MTEITAPFPVEDYLSSSFPLGVLGVLAVRYMGNLLVQQEYQGESLVNSH